MTKIVDLDKIKDLKERERMSNAFDFIMDGVDRIKKENNIRESVLIIDDPLSKEQIARLSREVSIKRAAELIRPLVERCGGSIYQSTIVDVDFDEVEKRVMDRVSASVDLGVDLGSVEITGTVTSEGKVIVDSIDSLSEEQKKQRFLPNIRCSTILSGMVHPTEPRNIPDALYAAIEKWARIRAGYWDVERYSDYCGLCYWVLSHYVDPVDIKYPMCEKYCPLFASGQCTEEKSFVWKVGREYDLLMDLVDLQYVDPTDQNHNWLIKAIDNMIAELQRLVVEYG